MYMKQKWKDQKILEKLNNNNNGLTESERLL